MSAAIAYLALGANLGDRRANLVAALDTLSARDDLEVTAVSPLYETTPVGGPEGQSDFLNAAARVRTTLAPESLLEVTQEIERVLGRRRDARNGPRIIDIDILLHGDHVRTSPTLNLPHPRMHERIFVLKPLADIAPDTLHPTLGRRIADLLVDLENPTGIHRIDGATWWSRIPKTPRRANRRLFEN